MSQLTQRGIIAVFLELLKQKPLDKITVTELVKACGISRKTFYNHFQTLDELVEHILEEETRRALSREINAVNWVENYLEMAGFLLNNPAAFAHLYHSHMHRYLKQYLYRLCEKALEIYAGSILAPGSYRPEDLRLLMAFYANGISGLVTDWVKDGQQADISGQLTELGRLLYGSLRSILGRRQSETIQNEPTV